MAVFTANNLYPGTIDTAMPGFNVEDGQVKIYFNFSQYNDITKIKQNYIQVTLKYQNNNLNALNDASEIILKNWNQDDNGYYFILEDSDLKDEEFIPYQYYKLQFRLTDIAASDKTGSQTIDNWLSAASTISGKTNLDESSEWSTICLIRGITALTLEVEGLTAGGNLQSVSNLDNVIGHVSFTAEDNIENTEYLKTVNLKLYDKDNVLIKDSGEIICDNYKAPNYFNYSFDYKFQKGNENPYKMEIVCITNTLYQETFIYNFYITEENIDFDFSPNLTTITDSETGTIKLGVEYKDSGLADTLKIYRTAATDNYSEKKEIYSGPFVKASESSYEYVTGTGTSITLDNTIQAKMKMSLTPSELEQQTYTGKNLYDVSKFIQGTWNNSSSNSRVVGFLKAVSTGESYTVSLYNTAYQFSIGNSTANNQSGTAVQNDSGWKTTTYTYNITGDGYLWVQIAKVNSDTITPSELKATDLQVETGSTATEYEPYVGGTASPNPSYPQDIHTISGNNSVVVEGKNLLDTKIFKNRMINCYVVNSNGTITQTATDTNFWQSSYLPNSIILNKGTYTISVNNRNRSKLQVYNLTTNSNIVEASVDSYTFTLNNDNQVINAKLYGASSYPFTFTMQLEKGTATSYTPYVSQTSPINLGNIEYCKIGNYEDKFILTSGKNLFDKNNITTGYYIASDGSLVAQASSWYSNYISVKPSTTYTIQVPSTTIRVAEYNNSKTFIQRLLDTTNLTYTFTTDSNTNYLRLSGENTQLNLEQLELGNQATDYEPYGTNQWYLKKNIGKVVLDGTEDWGSFTIEPSGLGRSILVISDIKINATNVMYMSDKLQSANYSGSWNLTYDNIAVVSNAPKIIIYLQNTTTLADFQTRLGTINPKVYYVKANPTYTQITGTLETQLNNIYKNMLSYKGTTNVSQINNDLSFNITASALKDTSSLLVNPQYLDTSFESGILYKYEVKAVNTKDNLKSKEFEIENPVGVMFDHIYLKSGNQQLKIKFNPQINSMKTIYSENKTDTLGSQYPFIKRNAAVKYRTFPISGLISYFMDGEHYFSSRSFEYGDSLNDYNTFNNNNQITSTRDYTYERLFRERVRNFLEDNKVKLFRSPTEGNMLIKLMDINFSPNQSTGRLIWNFSATAYEIDDMTIDNLKKYGIIPMDIDNNFGEDDYINDPALFSYMPHTSEEGSI